MVRKVLVADDEPALLRLMEFVLSRKEFELLVAVDGEAALALARAHRPDLVVLDIMMPLRDGYSVAEELRADAELGQVPIVMLSARTQDTDVDRAVEAGVDAFLPKPFSPDLFVQLVDALLDGAPMPETVRAFRRTA
ncbi:MAG: response regulator [Armatimonadota bacterium]